MLESKASVKLELKAFHDPMDAMLIFNTRGL